MTLVVDASVAIKFLVRESGNEEARDLLRIPDPLIAPDWLLVEAASVLWKKVKRSEVLRVHAERHLDDLPQFFAALHPAADLANDALRWGLQLRHSVYDCIYLALALREGAGLVTADEKLYALARQTAVGDKARLIA